MNNGVDQPEAASGVLKVRRGDAESVSEAEGPDVEERRHMFIRT